MESGFIANIFLNFIWICEQLFELIKCKLMKKYTGATVVQKRLLSWEVKWGDQFLISSTWQFLLFFDHYFFFHSLGLLDTCWILCLACYNQTQYLIKHPISSLLNYLCIDRSMPTPALRINFVNSYLCLSFPSQI